MPVLNNVLAGSSGQTSGGGSAPASDYTIERSLRFDRSSSAYLSKTFSTNGDRQKWTFSFWMKRCKLGVKQSLLGSQGTNNSDYTEIYIDTDDKLFIRFGYTSVVEIKPARRYRDTSAWQHIVLAMDTQASGTDRFKVYNNGELIEVFTTDQRSSFSGTYGIGRAGLHKIGAAPNGSADFIDSYLAEVHYVNGSQNPASDFGQYNTTTGVWGPKAFAGQHGTNGFHLKFADYSSDSALGTDSSGNNNTFAVHNLKASFAPTYSNNVTTNSGTGWFGGSAVNAFDGATNTFVQGAIGGDVTFAPSSPIAVGSTLKIWADSGSGFGVGNGPYTITYNGSSVYNSSMWSSPYTITAAAGTSLSSLAISPSGGEAMRLFAIEIDGTMLVNGDGPEGDSLIDTPTNYETSSGNNGGNYCTLNPLAKGAATSLSNGNLNYVGGASNQTLGTIGMSSGKWYWEDHKISGTYGATGIALADAPLGSHAGQGNSWAYNKNGQKWHNGSASSYGASWDSGDTIGIAFDADAGTLVFYKNGVSQGTAYTGLTNGPYFVTGADNSVTGYFNFGQRPFAYTPPTGHKAICTTNLPDPGVANPKSVMDIDVYNGTGATQARSEFSFSPELLWFKQRGGSSTSHALIDAVRGGHKRLIPNGTNTENDVLQFGGGVSAFTNNGFTLGTWTAINASSESYVAWAWDAENETTISAGGLNSSLYEQGAVWSNMVTCSGSAQSGTTFANIFDGNASTQFGTATGSAYSNAITFTPTTAINYTSSVKLISPSGQMAARINGGSWVNYTTNVTLATGSGTINSIEVTERRSNAGFGWNQLEIDGKIYVDQGVTPPSSTNVPSIGSTCRSNQSAGTSIVSYTGDGVNNSTIAHNLNAKPSLIITKNLDGLYNWIIYHSALSNTKVVALDGSWAEFTPSGGYYGDVTSLTYKVIQGSSSLTNLNNSGDRYISYCFAPVEGVSAMGVYTGSSNLPFVYTGFKVGFILLKRKDSTGDWIMHDTTRTPANGTGDNNTLVSNEPNGEDAYYTATQVSIDYLSNGFKLRHTGGPLNDSGGEYIWAAWASNPFKHQSRAN